MCGAVCVERVDPETIHAVVDDADGLAICGPDHDAVVVVVLAAEISRWRFRRNESVPDLDT